MSPFLCRPDVLHDTDAGRSGVMWTFSPNGGDVTDEDNGYDLMDNDEARSEDGSQGTRYASEESDIILGSSSPAPLSRREGRRRQIASDPESEDYTRPNRGRRTRDIVIQDNVDSSSSDSGSESSTSSSGEEDNEGEVIDPEPVVRRGGGSSKDDSTRGKKGRRMAPIIIDDSEEE